jgi:PqqD family protein of HPr-rel-A system
MAERELPKLETGVRFPSSARLVEALTRRGVSGAMPALKPKVRADLTVVEIDGEAVIYDASSGRLHHLNPAAAVIFQLCDGSGTIKELAAEIADVTNVPQDDIARQVRRMVKALRQAWMKHQTNAPISRRRSPKAIE